MDNCSRELLLTLSVSTGLVLYRYRHRDPTASIDLLCTTATTLWTVFQVESGISRGGRLICCIYIALFAFILLRQAAPKFLASHNNRVALAEPSNVSLTPWAVPCIIPSRTTHTRFFPEKHSFSYSYLLVGIPVGWRDSASRWLSADCDKWTLLHVSSADYLDRGHPNLDLRGKLDNYLESQNQDPHDFPFAYLVTAPRVLGYSFNPVSFWYLYTAERKMRAMVLEVNNTFDERRMYFLNAEKELDTSNIVQFSSTWKKDFHVSPFNDREGSYSLLAQDLKLSHEGAPAAKISNTITLMSSEKQPKLVARIFSTEQPIEASKICLKTGLRLIIGYGWVGYVTFARILREAGKLYFRKGLQVWFRPEVTSSSVGRTSTSGEKFIEGFFRDFLESTVQSFEKPMSVRYRPAQGLGEEVHLSSTLGSGHSTIELQALTPAFYSRLVGYMSFKEAIYEESRNRTIQVTNFDTLESMLGPRRPSRSRHATLSTPEAMRWGVLCRLRRKPSDTANADTSVGTYKLGSVHGASALSDLDQFVVATSDDSWLYRRQVTGELLAQRFAGGLMPLINVMDLLLRVALLWAGRGFFPGGYFGVGVVDDFVASMLLVSNASLVHVWAFAKGLGDYATPSFISHVSHVSQ